MLTETAPRRTNDQPVRPRLAVILAAERVPLYYLFPDLGVHTGLAAMIATVGGLWIIGYLLLRGLGPTSPCLS